MPKYSIQITVSVELAREIEADSLEEAIQSGRAFEKTCPVHAGLIKIGRKTEYLWDRESKLTGVTES